MMSNKVNEYSSWTKVNILLALVNLGMLIAASVTNEANLMLAGIIINSIYLVAYSGMTSFQKHKIYDKYRHQHVDLYST